ncbi:ATP-binding protein [Pelagibius sp.]|uniref:AAA family ATPase n=1 Tax=Pelagibius sp. TaxID=1931238 RepID=UPI002AC35F67|nr:ATP-binding protein [Pelagibius sp.]
MMTAAPPPAGGPVLHLLCGKIASGKSTLARRLAAAPHTVLICEDDWLARLYPGEIATLEDYGRCSRRLRAVMADHVSALLRSGFSVVMDAPANTVETRRALRTIFEAARVEHRLHFLDLPDDLCKARLRQRNAAGDHAFSPSDADYDLFTSLFQAPGAEEGFDLVVHPAP